MELENICLLIFPWYGGNLEYMRIATFVWRKFRDSDLPKEAAELLGSRLQEVHLLFPDTTFSWYRNREDEFLSFFK